MSSRARLEAMDHWQCTFRRTRPGVRERFDCLMRDIKGGFYWWTPDYQGAFAWGATRTFDAALTRDSLERAILELAAGTLPACLLKGKDDE